MLLHHWLDSFRGRLAWVARFGKTSRRLSRDSVRQSKIRRIDCAADILEARQMLSATAIDDQLTVHYLPQQQAFEIDVLQNDISASGSSITIVGAVNGQLSGTYGTLDASSGSILYTPSATPDSQFTFGYQLDGISTANVTVNTNQIPAAGDDNYSVGPGESIVLDLLTNDTDPEGQALSIQSVATPVGGSVALEPDVPQAVWDDWQNSGQ